MAANSCAPTHPNDFLRPPDQLPLWERAHKVDVGVAIELSRVELSHSFLLGYEPIILRLVRELDHHSLRSTRSKVFCCLRGGFMAVQLKLWRA